MEINEAGKAATAKPVPSRPTCSILRSFSELLAGAINGSPSTVTTVAAIRPKTLRFKPITTRVPQFQAELSGTALRNSSDEVGKSDSEPSIIYKPQAKLVSRTNVSLWANMGNSEDLYQEQTLPSVEPSVQNPNQEKHSFPWRFHQNMQSEAQINKTTEPPRLSSQNQEDNPKTTFAASNEDRPSYDGYNWRKYGQKQVKGSEYPRSYYKCTHPNCPVKKKVERSLDGQIAEIVYKGEHSHSKPRPLKRSSPGTQGLGFVSDGTGSAEDTSKPLWDDSPKERNEGSQDRNEIESPSLSSYQTKGSRSYDPAKTISISGVVPCEKVCGRTGECDEGSKGLEGDDDDNRGKKRKSDNQSNDTGMSGEAAQEPRLAVQSSMDTDNTGDGFRWRKYGQKVVKGNPYPRSYYRCTSPKCMVRKYVERASEEPGSFITTYEGKHNHERPPRKANSAASDPITRTPNPNGRGEP